MLLANGPVIVDGFFSLSGILLSYPLLVHLGKTERINIAMPIIVRFIR
jgi:peptidoglycan/LPS O-acetylase OafA/YrhL